MGQKIGKLNIDPDMLIYIGQKNGSGFIWIGRYKDLPEEFADREVTEMYPRTIEYKGIILLIDAGLSKKQIGGGHNYWNWSECDKSIPQPESKCLLTHDAAEGIIIAMMRDSAKDYLALLRYGLNWLDADYEQLYRERKRRNISESRRDLLRYFGRKVHQNSPNKIISMIKYARTLPEASLLVGTQTGDYILQRMEDELRVRLRTPGYDNMPYDKRRSYLDKETKKLRQQRVKDSESAIYAKWEYKWTDQDGTEHIEKRRVKHD